MKISCEKCKILFKIDDKNLSSDGITCLCPKCKHPHLVKRIVIPLGDEKKQKQTKKHKKDEQSNSEHEEITVTDKEPTIQKMMSTDMESFKNLAKQARKEQQDASKIIPYEKKETKEASERITLEKSISDEKSKEKINMETPEMPDPSLSMDTEDENQTYLHKPNPVSTLMFQLLLGFIIVLGVIFLMYILRII